MMGLMIKKSSKSLQNSLNDMTLNGDIDYTVTNSAYSQARAKLNYTAFIEMKDKSVEMFYEDGEYNRYKSFRLLAVVSTPDHPFTPAGQHPFTSKSHRYSQGIVAQVNG